MRSDPDDEPGIVLVYALVMFLAFVASGCDPGRDPCSRRSLKAPGDHIGRAAHLLNEFDLNSIRRISNGRRASLRQSAGGFESELCRRTVNIPFMPSQCPTGASPCGLNLRTANTRGSAKTLNHHRALAHLRSLGDELFR